jgi:hypothetical protein
MGFTGIKRFWCNIRTIPSQLPNVPCYVGVLRRGIIVTNIMLLQPNLFRYVSNQHYRLMTGF